MLSFLWEWFCNTVKLIATMVLAFSVLGVFFFFFFGGPGFFVSPEWQDTVVMISSGTTVTVMFLGLTFGETLKVRQDRKGWNASGDPNRKVQ